MWTNKKVRMLVAFIVAISVWIYVKGLVDPAISKNIDNVDINIKNQTSLMERNLGIDSVDIKTINVRVSGTRSNISDLQPDEVKATADVASAVRGENSIYVEVKAPNNVNVREQSVKRINVNVARLQKKEMKFSVSGKKPLEKNTTIIAEGEGKNVVLLGTANNLAKVKRVEARVDNSKLTEKSKVLQADLVAIDENGKIVDYVYFEENTVEILAKIVSEKKVEVHVPTTGKVAEGYKIESIEIPKDVVIVGNAKVLEKIVSIEAKEINIDNLNATTTIKIEIKLPQDVELKYNTLLTVKVNIVKDIPKIVQEENTNEKENKEQKEN
ncbi:MAG: CdaR family protein [Eubacteriales bacterium]|nr:CdaR family protein [Eubacteriales bacterium]MDY3332465.1 CdaR family protein [Gallibacter sp.]